MTYAEQLSQAVTDSMSPGLVGLYLHGSLALGDFVEGKSDVRSVRGGCPSFATINVRSSLMPSPQAPFHLRVGGSMSHVVTLASARNCQFVTRSGDVGG